MSEHSNRVNATKPPPTWLEESPIRRGQDDLLGYRAPAERIAERLKAMHPRSHGAGPESHADSLVLTFEGPWGSGKTSFSNLLLDQLRNKDELWHSPLEVHFSAWQAASLPVSPWEALAYRLGQALYQRFHCLCLSKTKSKVKIGHSNYTAQDLDTAPSVPRIYTKVSPKKAKLLERRLSWLEVAHRLSEAVDDSAWDPCLKLFSPEAPSKLGGRSLGKRFGYQIFVDAVSGLLQAAILKFEAAIGNAAKATKALLDYRLTEGPSWGIDTLDSARKLNRLLYLLHPQASHWRAVIVIEDATRLSDDDLPLMLDALGYLQELEDVLVILNVNQHVVEHLQSLRHSRVSKTQGKSAAAQGKESPDMHEEDFLTRLVNVRFPMPEPKEEELSRMLARFLEDLEIPPVTVVTPVLVHLLYQRSVTPRQIKRALLWIWFRLGADATFIKAEAKTLERLLILLLDLYLMREGHAEGTDILARVQGHSEILLALPTQPWDLRPWLDGFGNSLAGWENIPPEALHLLAMARMYDLQLYCGGTEHTPSLEEGQKAWSAWKDYMVQQNWLALDGQILEQSAAELFEHLLSTDLGMSQLWFAGQLTSAVRYQRFASDVPEYWKASSCSDTLADRFFDPDYLFQIASESRIGLECRVKAWILLFFVAPQTAEHFDSLLTRNPDVRNLLPQDSITVRDRFAQQYRRLSTAVDFPMAHKSNPTNEL